MTDRTETPRTRKECFDAVVKEMNFDTTHPFTKLLAIVLAMVDAHDETKAALERCQKQIHDLAGNELESEKLLDWAENNPESAFRQINLDWNMCGRGCRETRFNFRASIRAALKTPGKRW